jgi:hypothetical protein
MATLTRRLGAAALVSVAAALLTVTPASAVGPNAPSPIPYRPPVGFAINPSVMVAPGLPLNQAAFNIATLGRASRNVPPWLNGFSPVSQALPFGPFSPAAFPGLGSAAALTSTPYGAGLGASYAGSPGLGAYAGSPGLSGTPYDSGYAGGYGSSYPDPYGGGLRGAAEAIAAQGKYEIDFQRARLLNQEVERSKADTRRKIFDEWLYERANTPTLVDLQERAQRSEQRRAVLGMPATEVLNAHALNVLLDDLAKKANWAGHDPYGPIDPDTLKQINVTSGKGNIGALKPVREGVQLSWPLPLQGAEFQDEVRRLNQKAAEAVGLVKNTGQVDPATLNDMKTDIAKLRGKVSSHINELTPSQSIEANRFLNQLDDAVAALSQPDVANYFTDKFVAKGKTVPDLIKHMQEKGLKFAPAVGGDEAAYTALYNYLAGYASQNGQTASSGGGKE